MIDAPIDRQLQSLGDLILVDIRPAVHLALDPIFSSQGPTSQADFRNLEVGFSQTSIVHALREAPVSGRKKLARFRSANKRILSPSRKGISRSEILASRECPADFK